MGKQEPLISVIMPVYNGEDTILYSIKSILSQSYKNLELIIINDGSTDKSQKIIDSIEDKRIICEKIENTGSPVKPRNIAIRKSKGEFIALCDQDDIWYVDKLKKQIDACNDLTDQYKIGIIYSSANFINLKDEIVNKNIIKHKFLNQQNSLEKLLSGNFITACSAVFPKKVIKEVGLLNEELRGNDEYDFWLRIAKKYGTLGLKEPLCAWRETGSNYSAKKSKIYIENEKIFEILEKESTNFMIRNGHAKNLTRIIVSLMLEENFDLISKYLNLAENYPVSKKAKLIMLLFKVNSKFGTFAVRILNKIGLISL